MKARWWIPALVAGVAAWRLGSRPRLEATTPPPVRAPAVLLLEADPEGDATDVVLRAPGAASQPVLVGRVPHVPGSARRGVPCPGAHAPCALVVVAEAESRHATSYHSALYRAEGGRVARLAGGLADLSAPLVTRRGTVLVQRGRDGGEPTPDAMGRVTAERVDDLALDAVDPATGGARTLWSGRGQLAFLAAPLAGDEALVYHVTPGGAYLFALDAGTGATRPLAGPMPALARDFSYDAGRDEVVFARAARVGGEDYEVVALPAASTVGGALRVRWSAPSDHLMPRALRDGAIALSLPGDRGLGVLARSATAPARLAPEGDGADAVVAESPDGAWLALRHATRQREYHALLHRASGRTVTLDRPSVYVELVGFAGGAP